MSGILARRCLFFCFCLSALLLRAQAPAFKTEAVGGEPFGVCRVTVSARSPIRAANPLRLAVLEQVQRARVTESTGRALYPAVWDGRMRQDGPLSGNEHAGEARPAAALWFLFKGDGDLDLKLANLGVDDAKGTLHVAVNHDPERLRALRHEWQMAYTGKVVAIRTLDAYDPSIDLYLLDMLSRRMGLAPADANERGWNRDFKPEDVVSFFTGAESIRLAMQSGVMLKNKGEKAAEDPMVPLPEAGAPPEIEVPAFDEAKVHVEPLALRVPKACLYLRCAKFDEFLWLGSLLDRWGGEVRNIVSARGVDRGFKGRMERQLALRETESGRRFGWAVVKDVALIGTDTFFQEGSSIGLLFQARQGDLMRSHIEAQRQEALKADPTVSAKTIRIGDRDISLIESPDHSVRSFYVQDGDFHLVTNSLWIAKTFLDTGTKDGQSLSIGSLKEFRYARSQMPGSDQGAFIYLSDPFFRNLIGPAYRVEMTRRMRSAAELQVLLFAQAAAKAEGLTLGTLDSLVTAGFLPESFGKRVDGSAPLLISGRAMDSLRGARGSFLPVPDMELASVRSSEADAYREFVESYAGVWRNMDPVFGRIRREDGGKAADRVAMELHISPYARTRYGFFLGFVGKPSLERIAAVKGDILTLDVVPKLDTFLGRMSAEDASSAPKKGQSRVFAGLRDVALPYHMAGGELVRSRQWLDEAFNNLRGYVGEYAPKEGESLGHLFFSNRDGAPDAKGYTYLKDVHYKPNMTGAEAEVWSRTFNRFFYVLGTGRKLLESVTEQIKLEPAPNPAQLRLRVGNLNETRMAERIRAEFYSANRRASAGSALMLQDLQRQLGVSDAPEAARHLLDLNLVCPLGGTFERDKDAADHWRSNAWQEPWLQDVNQVPQGYRHPLMGWLLGLRLDLAIDAQTLQTRMELDTRK